MDSDEETYLLLLLADSNLPTGSFVASSGLESYIKHGFSSSPEPTTLTFLRDSLTSYARTSLAFVADAHRLVSRLASSAENASDKGKESADIQQVLEELVTLDNQYEALTLNHVARRASKAQGVALLTLYSKGFTTPSNLSAYSDPKKRDNEKFMLQLLDKFKLQVRREEVTGHLPVCWGALTAALGLTLERAQYLHLFLHARSVISASVRLNELGPYNAQQTLLHAVRPLVAEEVERCKHLRTGLLDEPGANFDEMTQGPANTWPLGEILATRHDLQHSRIFNS
ncbi:hypothetical protein D9611_002525 [Ephemerocybe angulata]|uniref:Urease accessory protein UreF n=1 Tax=Ephemerocybe angulata TaxID=980116 RepID=A0A8H5C3J5_9AGAR|nr:hypothetical protein D9611_002525 [Tulosesus angulatus]